ncbi:hypothetical protein BJ085DRAFT_37277 [Dimargaris cristalligena]|uniref:RNB domain-containing protein n=1 Tax=Dimargaris cristalligena TaxID=215637 RepID=A0A4P9ZXN4_9FUNG|nr:hypothetical protein BJ085DRAFT_37277 [Dimargaris cristalligena]|eukprot:RKP38423.1 hypothetical protein BJ085DRAFT_37277 [Dimargaris cristalligena]
MDTFRARRFSHGALELDSMEVKFQFSDQKVLENVQTKEALPIHRTVEEAMVLANQLVGSGNIYDAE